MFALFFVASIVFILASWPQKTTTISFTIPSVKMSSDKTNSPAHESNYLTIRFKGNKAIHTKKMINRNKVSTPVLIAPESSTTIKSILKASEQVAKSNLLILSSKG